MILVVNLNPSLDKIYTVPKLLYGQAVRAGSVQNTAGGKGTHVANVIKILGEECTVVGFLGGYVGRFIANVLTQKGITSRCTPIAGDTRCCINIATSDGKQTEVLEPGPVITESEQKEFLKTYASCLEEATIVVASGSLPKGVPVDFYKTLIKLAHEKEILFLLDTSGEALKAAISAKPDFVKPNQDEIIDLCGRPLLTSDSLVREVRSLGRKGIFMPTISLGKDGALIQCGDTTYHARPAQVDKVVNAVGSGDSFVAGLTVGLSRGYPVTKVLALASACGTANVLEAESGCVNLNTVAQLEKQVKITVLD